MRTYIFLPLALACFLILAACNGTGSADSAAKLDGKWQCDVKESIALAEQKAPEEIQEMRVLLEGILSVTTADFDIKSKTLTLAIGGMGEAHSYSLESEKGNTVTLKLDDGTICVLEFRSDDSILYYEDNDPDRRLIFSRVKADS